MASLLIKNAAAIVTCDAADTVYENAWLLIEDGAITYMGPEDRAAEEITCTMTYRRRRFRMNGSRP